MPALERLQEQKIIEGTVEGQKQIITMIETLHVSFHEVVNMNPRPINAVDRFLKASERFVVAAFFIICVSSDSLLKSSPVRVTSKNATSYKKHFNDWKKFKVILRFKNIVSK